jgi:hypothetical protein
MADNFNEDEQRELRDAARSQQLKEDFRHISRNRIQFLKENGEPDLDRILRFLTDVNTLFNTTHRPFRKITGNNCKI